METGQGFQVHFSQYVTGETFDVPGCCPNLSGLKVTCGLEVVLLTSALFNDQ